jgi:DNA-binding MarR family transcriptional regulator
MESKKTDFVDQVVDNLFYISPLVTKALKQSLRTKANLNPVTYYILRVLSRFDQLSMTEIGCKVQIPKPHLTLHVDKLIAEALVERIQDPTDRRVIRIKLTEKGRTDLEFITTMVNEDMKQRILALSSDKIDQLFDSTTQVRDILNEILS